MRAHRQQGNGQVGGEQSPRGAFKRAWWPHRDPEDGLFQLLDRRTNPGQWLRASCRTQTPLIKQTSGGTGSPTPPGTR